MTIDWITVSAQIINFLILVWLLKRFLYAPVIRAMDEREQRVTHRLKEANQREQLAEEQRKHYHQQQSELEQNRAQALKKASLEADSLKHSLLEDARAEVAEWRDKWQQQAMIERNTFLQSLQRRTANSVLTITRKVLHGLANTDLESQLIVTFIEKLNTLTQDQVDHLNQLDEPVKVVTSFALDKAQQDQVTMAICKKLAVETTPEFTVSPELVFGVQLNIAEQALSWNLASYLDDLNGEFDQALSRGHVG